MSAETLLVKLERVRSTGPSRWLASCPAHEDRSPSLSIRETDDGKVLLHCFGGCDTGAVLGALCLTVSDLFPARSSDSAPRRAGVPASDLLRVVCADITLCALLASEIVSSGRLSADDWRTFARAAARIGRVRDTLER